MRITFIKYIIIILLLVLSQQVWAQNRKISKDTLVVIGGKSVEGNIVKLTKSSFLKSGKITVNQKGISVEQFTYSMFSLGNNRKETIYDSMFPIEMKNAVKNKKINYRYINLENIKFRTQKGELILPKVDTIKVKFIYP